MTRPFFIVGCPRSGTTLLRLLLHAHSRLAVAPENYMISENLPLVEDVRDPAAAARAIVGDHHFADFGLDPGEVRRAIEALERPRFADLLRVIYARYAARLGKARWGDQTPAYALHLPAVRRLFPDAQVLHVLRDPRDVALSWRRLEEHRGHSLWHVGNTWRWYVETARRAARDLPAGDYLEVRYEDLVNDTEGELRRVCAFLDEAFEPAMLHFHREAERHIPKRMAETHHRKLTGPVQARNAGKWRSAMSLAERLAVEIPARPALAALDYPLSPLSLPGAALGALRSLKSRLRRSAPGDIG